jgi:cell division protein FtsQ
LRDERGKTLIPLFEFINNDDFWRAQIAQLVIAADGGVVMVPTLGKTYIDFGLPMNIESKFKKLALFYKKIIPNKAELIGTMPVIIAAVCESIFAIPLL